MSKFFRLAFIFLCINVMFSVTALAYLDPGTASMIIQMLAGLLLTAGASVGIFWSSIKKIFKRKDK